MKRLATITLAILLMAALPLAAHAKKPPKPEPPTQCVISHGVLYEAGRPYAGGQHVCRWMVTDLPSAWTITLTPTGTVQNVVITVRDNAPGDFCGSIRSAGKNTEEVTLNVYLPEPDTGNVQCVDENGDWHPYGDPEEFYLLVQNRTRPGNTAAVTIQRTS